MDNILLVIGISVAAFAVVVGLVSWFIFRKPTPPPPPPPPPVSKSQTHIDIVNNFFNQTQKIYLDGHDDAVKDDTVENLREGLMRIKSEGKQICINAILAYQKEVRKLENEIVEENRFLEGSAGNSTQADRKTVEKDNIQKDIEYIEDMKSSLDDNELSIYASYRAGFAKGRNDKNK